MTTHRPPVSDRADASLLDPDSVEPPDLQGMQEEVLYLVPVRSDARTIDERHPWRVAVDQFLRLHIKFRPCGLIAGLLGVDQETVDRVALVKRDIGRSPDLRIVLIQEHVEEVVRISIIPNPSQDRHWMFRFPGLLQVRAPLERDELGADPRLRELLLQRLGDLLRLCEIRTRPVGPPQFGVDAVGESGLGEQLLGFADVVSVILDAVVVAPNSGRHRVLSRLRDPAVEGLHERGLVDGVADGLTDTPVVECRILRVHGQVADVQARTAVKDQIFVTADAIIVWRVDLVHHLHGSAFHLQQPHRVVRDAADDQAVDAWAPRPVVLVSLVGDVILFHPFYELERPSATWLLEEIRPVFPDCRRAGNACGEHRHVNQKGCKACAEYKPDGQWIYSLDALDVLEGELGVVKGPGVVWVLRIDLPVVIELYGLSVERCAVVELDSTPQFERPDQPIRRHGPRLSERRLYRGGVDLVAHQRVKDV